MLQTFRRQSDSSLIIAFRANVPVGQVDDADAPIRYAVHKTLGGVQVELREDPPVVVPGDQPITLTVPLLTAAELAICRGMRVGTYGLPVVWSNSLVASRQVIVVAIQSKPRPGAGATLNAYFTATLLLQPI